MFSRKDSQASSCYDVEETQPNIHASGVKKSLQDDYKTKKDKLFNRSHDFFSKAEVPALVSFLAKSVIKTLEPLIDAHVNERLLLLEQKTLELETRIAY